MTSRQFVRQIYVSVHELAALSVRMFKVLLRDMPQSSSALLGSLAGQLRQARGGRWAEGTPTSRFAD